MKNSIIELFKKLELNTNPLNQVSLIENNWPWIGNNWILQNGNEKYEPGFEWWHAWVFPMADRRQDPTIDGGNNSEDQKSTDTDKADDQPRRELV